MICQKLRLHRQLSVQLNGLLRIRVQLSYGYYYFVSLVPEVMLCYPDLKLDIDFCEQVVPTACDSIDVVVRISQPPTSQVYMDEFNL